MSENIKNSVNLSYKIISPHLYLDTIPYFAQKLYFKKKPKKKKTTSIKNTFCWIILSALKLWIMIYLNSYNNNAIHIYYNNNNRERERERGSELNWIEYVTNSFNLLKNPKMMDGEIESYI